LERRGPSPLGGSRNGGCQSHPGRTSDRACSPSTFVRVSLAPEADRDLVEGGLYYSREANEELGRAFVPEFERSAALLGEQPEIGAPWRGEVRRFPLRRFSYSFLRWRIKAVSRAFGETASSPCCLLMTRQGDAADRAAGKDSDSRFRGNGPEAASGSPCVCSDRGLARDASPGRAYDRFPKAPPPGVRTSMASPGASSTLAA